MSTVKRQLSKPYYTLGARRQTLGGIHFCCFTAAQGTPFVVAPEEAVVKAVTENPGAPGNIYLLPSLGAIAHNDRGAKVS